MKFWVGLNLNREGPTSPFYIIQKDVFSWSFILKENILFWFTVSYQKLFAFSVSLFCSQIFTLKLNYGQKLV